MNDRLVVLVNPNMVRPPIAPYALDVLTTSLEQAGFDVLVIDLTFRRTDWRAAVAAGLAGRTPLLVGVTIRNTDTVYAYEQRPFVGEHRAVICEVRRHTRAPVVVGGIGFSTMPFALVDYFGVEYGVQGPGEHVLCDLAAALADGRPAGSVAGLIVNSGDGNVVATAPPAAAGQGRVWQVNRTGPYRRRSGDPSKVDNLAYYRVGGLGGILTKNGCPYRCSHCVEPDAKGGRVARRDVAAVVDEMESLVADGIHDLHTTDSEFNLGIAHSKALLREIARRTDGDPASVLRDLRLWVYCQPAPFDEEFAELLAAAGCVGVNVGADHVRAELLDGWKVSGRGSRYYDVEDTARLVKLCHKYGMMTMVEALFGMPGETEETMRECVERFLALDATVTGFSLGLRLFPHTPLGRSMALRCDGVRTLPGLQSNTATEPIVLRPRHRCASDVEYERQFLFDDAGNFRLVCYFSPDLPEDPADIGRPNGRWRRSLRLLWDCVPASEHHRVMLPTPAGISEHDNNYADNPFLTSLTGLGYTGAFWAHWRAREAIMARART